MSRVVGVLQGLILSLWILSPVAIAGDALLEIRQENWLEAMEIGNVDSEILYAIALRESGTSFNGMRKYGPWPWVMNIREKAKFYSTREAARSALDAEIEKGNNRIAVGIWQIYLRYNAHYVESPLDLIDPVTNLYVAAKVLRGCGKEYSTILEVLSCYHSGDVDDAGKAYARQVIRLAEKWGKPYSMPGKGPSLQLAKALIEVDGGVGKTELVVRGKKVDMVADVSSGAKNSSFPLLASAKQPFSARSHADFLRSIRVKDPGDMRRIIILENSK